MRIVLAVAVAALVAFAVQGAAARRALAPEPIYADFLPVVSPNGTSIAFLRQGITSSHLVRAPSLYLVGTNGRGVVALTRGSAQSSSNAQVGHFDEVTGASWSPDGQRLVYANAYRITRYDVPLVKLVVADADGTNAHELPGSSNAFLTFSPPSWSSARNQIAFFAGDGLRLVNPDGSGTRQLTNGNDSFSSWSPDGKEIAFVRDKKLAILNLDDSSVVLTDLQATSPSWSPDGKWIAFSSRVNGNTDIYVAAPDGDMVAVPRLTTNPAEDITPTWTPDGKSIVFGSSRGRGVYSGDLWIMNADGSNQRLVIPRAAKHASNGRRCTITGTAATDGLLGTQSNDVLCGFAGNDHLVGLGGGDVIDGGPGRDLLEGGPGNDLILARDHRKDDVRGGPGFDRAQIDKGLDKVSGVEKILP